MASGWRGPIRRLHRGRHFFRSEGCSWWPSASPDPHPYFPHATLLPIDRPSRPRNVNVWDDGPHTLRSCGLGLVVRAGVCCHYTCQTDKKNARFSAEDISCVGIFLLASPPSP